jgi:hypothetical protein
VILLVCLEMILLLFPLIDSCIQARSYSSLIQVNTSGNSYTLADLKAGILPCLIASKFYTRINLEYTRIIITLWLQFACTLFQVKQLWMTSLCFHLHQTHSNSNLLYVFLSTRQIRSFPHTITQHQ